MLFGVNNLTKVVAMKCFKCKIATSATQSCMNHGKSFVLNSDFHLAVNVRLPNIGNLDLTKLLPKNIT